MEPYKGLRAYEESDQDNFFGREVEKRILIDKILTHKLTFLFAASGVGKSSLLQAAVLPELKRPSRKDREPLDVIYYKDWVGNPVVTLKNTLIADLKAKQQLTADYTPEATLSLKDFFQLCTAFTSEPLVIILDQFEEFFNYQRFSEHFQPIIVQLAEAIHDRYTATAFVISMREDFALELNAFKEAIPTFLIDNFYRLEKLTRDNAEKAIVTPIEKVGFRYAPDLLKLLLTDLSLREQRDRYGSELDAMLKGGKVPFLVEPPHLQMICKQLWTAEKNNPDKCITKAVYENKGRAKGLLKTYFVKQVEQLSSGEKKLASSAFNYLVNKHGTKMAYPLTDLAQLIRVEESALGATLDKLDQARILHRQRRHSTVGTEGGILWYELHHDIFSQPIYDWNEAYKNRQRIKKITITMGAAVVGIAVLFVGYDFFINYTHYHLRLSAKVGVSDTIELYQGKKGSLDIFGQQKYLRETGYVRADIEPDKLFTETPVAEFDQLTTEIIGRFPSKNRIAAYYETGNIDKALELVGHFFSFKNTQLSEQMVDHLEAFRSVQTIKVLKHRLTVEDDAAQRVRILRMLYDKLTPKQATPLLLSLVTDKNDRIRLYVVGQLERLGGDDEVIEALSFLLDDKNFSVRRFAAEALAKLGDNRGTDILIEWTKDKDSYFYVESTIQALMQLGHEKKAIKVARELFKKMPDHPEVINVLAQLGNNKTIEDLVVKLVVKQVRRLHDKDEDVRQRAVAELHRLGSDKVIAFLLKRVTHPESLVRRKAAYSFGLLGNDKAIEPLTELLNDQDRTVRFAAAYALAQLGNEKAINLLIEKLQDRNSSLRYRAAEALSFLRNDKVVEPLIESLKDPKRDVRAIAAKALGRIGSDKAVEPLIESLKDPFWEVRQNATDALLLGSDKAVEPLIEKLKDEDVRVRQSAARTLGWLGNDKAVEPLIERLKKGYVYDNYVTALGQLGSEKAVEAIISSSAGKSRVGRIALGDLGSDRAFEYLMKQFETEKEDWKFRQEGIYFTYVTFVGTSRELEESKEKAMNSYNRVWVRTSAIRSLGYMQAKSTLPELHVLLDDKDSRIRQAVVTALNEIASPQSIALLEKRIMDSQERIATRTMAIKALGKIGTEAAVQSLIKAAKQFPHTFSFVAYHALAKTRSATALPFLRQQLTQLQQRKREWRNLRDEIAQQDNVSDEKRQRLTELSARTFLERELGYVISLIDPDKDGVKLLSHDLAEVRRGAWLGIGMVGKVSLVKRLHAERDTSKYPLFRHAAYQAIDRSLITLEESGKLADLQALQAWLPAMTDSAVRDRVAFTVVQLEYRLGNTTVSSGAFPKKGSLSIIPEYNGYMK